MATKTRELVAELIRNGFRLTKQGKGSHRKFIHPSGAVAVVPGHDGDDAKPYLEKQIRRIISEASKAAGA